MSSKFFEDIKNSSGVALISAMGLTMVVLVASLGLIYRLTNFTQVIGTQNQKTQTYYSASSGIEEARDYLWLNACIPPFWCGRLGEDLQKLVDDPARSTIPSYSDLTCEVNVNQPGQCTPTQETASNPAEMNIVTSMGQSNEATFTYQYTLHIKDNHDEPNASLDYAYDNDEVVSIISTATGADETKTTIEAMIIYTGNNNPYKQKSQDPGKTGGTAEGGVVMPPAGGGDQWRQTF